MNKHLWEVEHEYYCSEDNYYQNNQESYDSFASFIEEYGPADMDMNLVFRFDWTTDDDGSDVLKVFWMLQRKGIFKCTIVNLSKDDEPAVIEFLKPRFKHIIGLWGPLEANE